MLEIIRSRVAEGYRFSPIEVPVKTVPLWVALTASTTSGNASWDVPNGYRFRVQDIAPHLVFEPVDETMSQGGIFRDAGAGTDLFQRGLVEDRIIAKMMNCNLRLSIVLQSIPIFPQLNITLWDLAQRGAELASFFDVPGVLRSGQTIRLEAELQDSGGAGSSTRYGVELRGAMIRIEEPGQIAGR